MSSLSLRRRRPPSAVAGGVRLGTALAAASFAGLVAVVAVESWPVWRQQGVAGYVLGRQWFYRAGEFGALPMIYGTATVAAIALLLATPIGIGAAIFSAEYLRGPTRLAVKGAVELLAGVPSVVYGLLGVLLLRGWIYRLFERFEPLSGDTLLTGGVLLAVMVLPTVMSLADDALSGVPKPQRQASRALGLTRAEAVVRVSLPQAMPGLVAAVLLALGRALGETIAVFLVIGRQDNQLPGGWLDLSPLVAAGQTLTSKLGGSETFLAVGDPLHWAAIVGLAVLLLAMTLGVTLAGAVLAGGGWGGGGPTIGARR